MNTSEPIAVSTSALRTQVYVLESHEAFAEQSNSLLTSIGLTYTNPIRYQGLKVETWLLLNDFVIFIGIVLILKSIRR